MRPAVGRLLSAVLVLEIVGLFLVAAADQARDESTGPPLRPVLADPLDGAPKGLEPYYSQKLTWVACDDWYDADRRCASMMVPLDYAAPEAERITIRVLRVAADPDRRIGSLVVNPGGPGSPGTDYADTAGGSFGDPILEHYDLVGFDPRGTGWSDTFDCLGVSALDEYLAADPTPDSAAERATFTKRNEAFGIGCASDFVDDRRLAEHVSTVEAARDMDILRAVLRQERLDYFGASYGSKLGATYADLFPSRVGRMVLDGGVGALSGDPDGPPDGVVHVPPWVQGFQVALDAYVDDCVEGGDCVFGTSREAALARISKFLNDLDAAPLATTDPDDRDLTEGLAVHALTSQLYGPAYWSSLTSAFKEAFAGDGTMLLSFADAYTGRWSVDGDVYYDGTWEAFVAISCVDDPWSLPVDTIADHVWRFERASQTFGEAFAYRMAICSGFRYRSPYARHQIRATDIDPILVTGTTRDSVTTLKEAQALASQLESAVLIRRDGDGHTAYNSGNACVDDAIESYLLDGTIPTATLDC